MMWPSSWTWATIELLAAPEPNSITDGPFGSNLKTSHYTTSGPRVIRLQNIGDGVFVDSHAHIPPEHFKSLARHRIFGGDIVIAALGDAPPRSCVIPASVGPAIVKADCIRFRPDPRLADAKFLNFMLNAEPTRKRTASRVHGVGRPRLNLSEIKTIELPLPPLAEQRRIVAAIEEQFTRLDAAVAGLKRTQANLRRYRAAVLAAACSGRLVPTEAELARQEGRDYEPADQLLARILQERRARWGADELAKMRAKGKAPKDDRWKAKYTEPEPPDTSDVPELPNGWTLASTAQLTMTITSGSRDWSKYYGRGSGTFLMAQNVRPGKLDLGYRQAVDPPLDDRDRVRSQVEQHDLLVTIVGANTGEVCRVPVPLRQYYVCQSVALMRPVDSRLSRFVGIYLNSEEHGQRQYRRYIYGAGRPHLSFDQLKMTPVAFPPLAEQERIVAEVERRLSVIEEMETTVEHSLKRADRLRQAILKRAFEGKLVPQDPTDEPASVLLERIRVERQAVEPNGKKTIRRSRRAVEQLVMPLVGRIGEQ